MALRRGDQYPASRIRAFPLSKLLAQYRQPDGLGEHKWPPVQLAYIETYLQRLECRSILIEEHYVDRDFVDDVSLFYARSLRAYPSYCQRLHFFRIPLSVARWKRMVTTASRDETTRKHVATKLQAAYLGFSVKRPLPAYPVGRTVLRRMDLTDGRRGDTIGVDYAVHLGPFDLNVHGLAFQQQDQGVSACATTALWTALHQLADIESLRIPTPAFLTEAACRYYLPGGRALPQEGLTLEQICEACRAAGLSPVVFRGLTTPQVRGQLYTLLRSGFPALLGLFPVQGGEGHAITLTSFSEQPIVASASPFDVSCVDASTAIDRLFIHDDRIGPDVPGRLGDIRVEHYHGKFRVAQPDSTPDAVSTLPTLEIDHAGVDKDPRVIKAIVAAMPAKIRLSVSRLREMGLAVAKYVATGVVPDLRGRVVFSCFFQKGIDALRLAGPDSLSDASVYRLQCETTLSRYVGRVELTADGEPLFDILLDATETEANPAVIAFIARRSISASALANARFIAAHYGVDLIT